ncbi:hypothetical protein HK097_011188 [Rhizophlyctis rosea]|uniref:Protein kinase domain-containing protein n=1 Tax=Rhizophlyctis rosea TaxID=64517 RepID=A0AAD5SK18_9FUNG|nr:hypothetical protein HK097_011188 [Rhizophlyctis rosea]
MAALHERTAAGDLEGLKEALIGIDDESEGINARDLHEQTILHIACQNGHTDIVEWALENKAQVDCLTVAGDTALITAATNGQLDIVKKASLTAAGADVNRANDHGNTALHYACMWRFKDIALHLAKEAGATVAVKNKYSKTPLSRTSKEIQDALAEEAKNAPVVQAKARTFAEAKEEAKIRFMAKGGVDWEISPGAMQIQEQIATSATSDTFKGLWNGYAVAVKSLKDQENLDLDQVKAVKAEIQAIRKVFHPNLVPILAACVTPPKVAILTEFFPFGDAYNFLHDASLELSPTQAMKMATDVAKALLFLHEQNPPLYHHNLRSQNVMLIEDGSVKLIDYGFHSSIFNHRVLHPRRIYNLENIAPEILTEKEITDWAAVDVYAFGILLYEIVTRQYPYPGVTPMSLGMKVALEDARPQILEYVPEGLAKLMTWSWDKDPKKRPTMKQVNDMLTAIRL